MSSTLQTFVPVLDGTNYQQWAASMQSYLMSQGQWRCVIKDAPAPVKGEDNVVTNQTTIDDWEANTSKAVGNIRLRLHHTIAYQYNTEESAKAIWEALQEKYGRPGVSRAFLEFKGTMETIIPGNQDPSPAIDKMMSHFACLKDIDFEVPEKVQAMMYLMKAPQNMETIVQIFAQSPDLKEVELEKVIKSMQTSWQKFTRSGAKPQGQNQQRAHKLSAVKRGGQPPQFQQQ